MTTSHEQTTRYLQRIHEKNRALGAYLHVADEAALIAATQADTHLATNAATTPLTGKPMAIKDLMHVPGMPTTCASKILEGFRPTFACTAVQRLADAGAIFLGKTNMDEFAMGASNEYSAYTPARNPWDTTRIPGGSSGGSAVAVAADLCWAALGSDTGGSIRQPAALCGIVGFKPTYGRVSRYGLVAFASSLDQIGPMAKTVEDATKIYQTIAGHDPADSTSLETPVGDPLSSLGDGIKGLRIGIPDEYFVPGMEPAVEQHVRAAIVQLQSLGATITPISLPHTKYAVPCYYIIAPAEASANLARYDGMRYGQRAEGPTTLRDSYAQNRSHGFGPEVTRRIILGTYVLSSGYYDAYYLKAQKVRTLIAKDFATAFASVDVICTPTAPYTAFPIGAKIEDPVQMYLADVCTAPVNLAGLPGISIPCGFTDAGLPIGLQLIGKTLDDATVLRTAHTYEQTTAWHTRRPA